MDRRQRRIRRVSRVMKLSAYAVALFLAVFYAAAFVWPREIESSGLMLAAAPEVVAGSLDYVVVFVIGAVPLTLVLIAVVTTARLFTLFERGGPLSPEAGRLLSKIGLFVVLSQVASIVASSVAGAFVSWRAGEGALAITIGSAGMISLVFGGLLLVLGWVMAEVADIVEDHRQIV